MKTKSVILGIIIIVVVCLVTTGCIFYNLLDTKEFKEHFGSLGYTVTDSDKGLYDSNSYVIATKEDVPYKIEYYEFADEIAAKKAYEKQIDAIANYITSTSKNERTDGAVFSKTVAVSEKEYIVISRVKNTMIFIASTKDYQQEIDSFLKDIKY